MNDVWFSADLHLGHDNIRAYSGRPFNSVAEMNQALIDNWNDIVSPSDRVFVLGDVALGKRAETVPLAAGLNGHKFLVPGNHDGCWPGHRKARSELYVDAGFEILPVEHSHMVNGRRLLMCHFPYEGDSHDVDRYEDWRPEDKGDWLLHGHVHEAFKTRGRMINVGVDVWDYRPVHVDEILEIIAA